MKALLVIALVFGATNLFASSDKEEGRQLTIDSFFFVENNSNTNRAAELCGHVDGKSHLHDRVTVSADYRTKTPGNYTLLLNEEGKFCVVVRTLTGTASAKFWRVGEPDFQQTKTIEVSK